MATKTITLSEDAYRRWEARARRHGRTVSEEIETAAPESNGSAPGEEATSEPGVKEPVNPNQWLIDLAYSLEDVEWKPGPRFGSPEWKDMYARDLYRDTFNREPDW